MDSEKKQRVSFYLDRELVNRADAYQEMSGCNSRNEFVAEALESYITELSTKTREDIFIEKLASAIEKAVDFEAVKISKGLFRYAVELDVIIQMLANGWDYEPGELHDMRGETIKNVRRTCGKVRLDDLFKRKDTDSL